MGFLPSRYSNEMAGADSREASSNTAKHSHRFLRHTLLDRVDDEVSEQILAEVGRVAIANTGIGRENSIRKGFRSSRWPATERGNRFYRLGFD